MVGEREPCAERQDHQPGEHWPAGGEAQQYGAERQRRGIEEQHRHRRPARTRDMPRQQPSHRHQYQAGAEVQQFERAHHGERM